MPVSQVNSTANLFSHANAQKDSKRIVKIVARDNSEEIKPATESEFRSDGTLSEYRSNSVSSAGGKNRMLEGATCM